MLNKGGFGMILAVNVIGYMKAVRNEGVKRNMVGAKAYFLYGDLRLPAMML